MVRETRDSAQEIERRRQSMREGSRMQRIGWRRGRKLRLLPNLSAKNKEPSQGGPAARKGLKRRSQSRSTCLGGLMNARA